MQGKALNPAARKRQVLFGYSALIRVRYQLESLSYNNCFELGAVTNELAVFEDGVTIRIRAAQNVNHVAIIDAEWKRFAALACGHPTANGSYLCCDDKALLRKDSYRTRPSCVFHEKSRRCSAKGKYGKRGSGVSA
jgi:hypothetical protein